MVSKKNINDLDFENINQYFEYIISSEINGNRSQVYSLINKLSTQQKKDFLEHVNEYGSGSDTEIVKNILIQSFKK